MEFAGGSGPAVLVGSSYMIGQGGSGLAPCLAGPVAERRDSQAVACLSGSAAAPPRLKPGDGSHAPHVVGMGSWQSSATCRSGAERRVRELILFFY